MNKDVTLITAGRLLQAFLTIIALRIITSFLSPHQVGLVYLMLSFAGWFGLFLLNPVGMYLNRKLYIWHDAGELLRKFFIFSLYTAGVALIAVPLVLAVRLWTGPEAAAAAFIFALTIAAYVYSVTCNQTLIPALNALGYRGPFVFLSVLTSGLGLVFSMFLVSVFSASAICWLGGQIAAFSLMALAGFYMLKKRTGETIWGEVPAFRNSGAAGLREALLFSIPLSGATFFMWLQNQSYRIIVERNISADFLGVLSVGLGIASGLAAVAESLVQQMYFPGFYRRISDGNAESRRAALAELAEKTLPVYLILACFVAASAKYLAWLLVAEKFKDAYMYVAFGAFIELFRMSTNILAAGAHSEMRTRVLIKPYFMGGVFTSIAVLAVCVRSHSGNLAVPSLLAAGGLVTFAAMKIKMNGMVRIKLNYGALLRAALACAPFIPLFFIKDRMPVFWSVICFAGFSAYFIFLEYRVSARWIRTVEGADFLRTKTAGGVEVLNQTEPEA